MSEQLKTMDIKEIINCLPHRYPFLLIDRVLDYTPGESLHAIKNVTINEPFFQGHFPVQPVMPGVLILEAMARFKRVVEPGDQLHFEVKMVKERRGIGVFTGVVKVDGELVCSAEIMCARREIKK